jgi:hypothetical protein
MIAVLGALVVTMGGGRAAADELAPAGPVPVDQMRGHVRQVLETLEKVQAALPPATEKELRALLRRDADDAEQYCAEVQKLLDVHCLAGVTINPESRVKAARGPAEVNLRMGKETVALVKVSNEAGVTAELGVSGPGVRGGTGAAEGEWLQVIVTHAGPPGKGLKGGKLEYVLVRLTASEAGKREATLRFDVGQGTQDLGFRAEIPVLFTIEKEARK